MREPITNGRVGYTPHGLGIENNGKLRYVVMPDGIHLVPDDFDGLSLPFITFSSDEGVDHVFKVLSSDEIIVDDNKFISEKRVQDLINQRTLTSPNGTVWKPVIDDTGKVTYVKKEK